MHFGCAVELGDSSRFLEASLEVGVFSIWEALSVAFNKLFEGKFCRLQPAEGCFLGELAICLGI
jgi:hypothetical protein